MFESKYIVRPDSENITPDDYLPDLHPAKAIWQLRDLDPGNRFTIPGLEDNFKNLYVKSLSDCAVYVSGEFREKNDEPYVRLKSGYSMALTTRVKRI